MKVGFWLVVVVTPLALWVAAPQPQLIWADWYFSLTTVGKAAALVGVCAYAGNLVLSGRYRILDRAFDGLDRLYRFHRRNGILAVTLLSVHVLIMVGRTALLSLDEFWRSLFDLSSWALNFGRIAYAGLITIIGFTLLRAGRVKYELLKRTHQFLGVFFFAASLHVFLIPSDVSQNLPLRWYVLGLAAIGTSSFLVRTGLRRWLVPKIVADVTQVQVHAGTVTEVVMQPRHPNRPFLPGQFVFTRFRQSGFPYEEHPFSLTASPQEGRLRISAKAIGDYTRVLPALRAGAVAELYGPFGAFSMLRVGNPRQLWVAGGIGVTPFLSMARTLRDHRGDPAVDAIEATLVYSVQAPGDFVFRSELEAIAHGRPAFRFIPWVTAERGYLTAESLRTLVHLEAVEVFICGPKPMMRALVTQLRADGVRASHIRTEEFRLFG